MTTTPVNHDLLEAVTRRHAALGRRAAVRRVFAPGRVDLVGAHVDYNGGDVLPVAVDRGVIAVIAPRTDGVLRLCSLDVAGGSRVVDLDTRTLDARRPDGWAAYPAGVIDAFARHTGNVGGVDLVVGGDLPMGAGLSSSAALEVATAVALDALYGTGLDPVVLARIAHAAETGFVGVPCGIMDPYASALCRQHHALLLHCHDASFEHVPLGASGFELLVMNTHEPRTLARTGYAERVAECAAVAAALGAGAGVGWARLDVGDRIAELPEPLRRRARHVVSEHRRVGEFVAALGRGDLAAAGALMDASHRSATDDFDVGTPALDAITAVARRQDGVFGARLCGAGFGGCAVALVRAGAAAGAAAGVRAEYRACVGVDPGIEVVRPGAGARVL